MFKNLPESILRERNIMHSAEQSESILRLLPQFLNTLSKDKKTGHSISTFEKELKKAEKEQDQNIVKAIEWVKEKIVKLRTSIFAQDLSVKHAIERLENALQNTNNLPSAIHFDLILANLQQAVSNLATSENDAFFEGWAKTRMPPSQRDPNGKNDNCRTTDLQYGVLEELLLPDYVVHMLSRNGSKGLQRWKSHRETDPATLLGFLKTLSKYGLCETTEEPNFLKLRCAQDAEELCLQGHPWPYLRQFSSTNPTDHPLSREQVLLLTDTFLNMVERHISEQSDKPLPKVNTAPKNDPRLSDREIAWKWMRTEWAKDELTTQRAIVSRFTLAVITEKVVLTKDKYEPSTYLTWARAVDPLPIEARKKRNKSRNMVK